MKKFSFKLVGQALKGAFKGFGDDKVTKLSASLAYYTIFSLAPLMLLIISIAGIVMGQGKIEQDMFHQLSGLIGADAGKQIQELVHNAAISGKSTVATIIGAITLLIGATTVFGEIQDSINSIWGLKPRPKVGIMKLISSRLLSFGMIASLGFLLLVSLLATSLIEGLGGRLQQMIPGVGVVVLYIINLVLTLAVTTVLFAAIFKVLPDAKFRWKDIWPGAIATSLLFMVGKFAISLYISKSDIGSTFGSAGSLVILLVWIYYSAIILYFGAEFTKAYAFLKGAKIIPNKYAEWADTPAVAGAEPRNSLRPPVKPAREPHGHLVPASDAPHETGRRATNEGPMYTRSQTKKIHHKNEAGMGTMLLGLTLYMLRGKKGQG